MKITKTPYDFFGFGMPVAVNVFIMSFFITFSQVDKSNVIYYVYNVIFMIVVIVQTYSTPFKLFKKVKRYNADNEQLYPYSFMEVTLLVLLPVFILIIMKWKFPYSSEALIWIISFGGIIFLLYLLKRFVSNEFDSNEPYHLLIDSKKLFTFYQRNFSVKFEKENIKQMTIKPEEKTITINTGEKIVLQMPFHLRPTLELMRLDFSDQNPHWFIDN